MVALVFEPFCKERKYVETKEGKEMNYQIRSTTTADTAYVIAEIGPVGLTRFYIDAEYPIKKRKFKSAKRMMGDITERERSLLDCMNATWETMSRPIFQNGYHSTPKINKAEKKVVDMRAKVLDGKASLSDFRKVVEQWEKEVILANGIAPQGTIDFVDESTKLN